MPRRNLLPYFSRVRNLKIEIDQFVPMGHSKTVTFRADLAGLLVVLVAATYENCIKESLNTFSSERHKDFGGYTERNYAKLNSKIQINDLFNYIKIFNYSERIRFNSALDRRNNYEISRGLTKSQAAFKQILSWRHDFAHSGIRNTTVEEVFDMHQSAKHVLYCFEEALNGP